MNSRIPSQPRMFCQLLLTIFVLSSVLCSTLPAQNSQGTVLGHVTDPTGAVVPGASVKLTN
ncbi:MAG TPA: carboxypeptidase-like regulatory domain-containing protein, partial [Terriglobales bacterium]